MFSWLIAISLISTGLFAGLMMTLVFLLQKQWSKQSKNAYAVYFKEFLLVAKGHPLITVITFLSFILPTALAIMSFIDGFVLSGIVYAVAAAVFFMGCLVVTVFLNLPIYNKVIAWETEADYNDWQNVRSRFFTLNVVRFSSAFTSFVLLLLAVLWT